MRDHTFPFSTQTMHGKRDNEIAGINGLQKTLSSVFIQLLKAGNRLEDKCHVNEMCWTRLQYIAHLGMALYACQYEPLLQEVDHVLIDLIVIVRERLSSR